MRTTRITPILAILAALPACKSSDEETSDPIVAPDVDAGEELDPETFAKPAQSCAYKCEPDKCKDELANGYQCQNMGDWAAIPHADACGATAPTPPEPVQGQCTATAPTGEAAKYAGPDPDRPGVHVLPDGRRVSPAGATWIFREPNLDGSQTPFAMALPGTPFAVAISAGHGPHVVRTVDTGKIDGTTDPVVSEVVFRDPEELSGPAAFRAPDRLYLATAYGTVQAVAIDTQTGVLVRDDARSIQLPPSKDGLTGEIQGWYAASVAVSPDGKKLVVGSVVEKSVLVYDLTDGATYGQLLAELDVGADQAFQIAFDPNDATGRFAYLSQWSSHQVREIDLADPAHPAIARTFTTDRAPEGMAFLDGRWLAVANDLGDTISVVDRTSGAVTSVPVDVDGAGAPKAGLYGLEPSSLGWDASTGTLYAALAGANAVGAWKVDVSQATPVLTPAGRIPTAWWPAGVVVLDSGALLVPSLRGFSGTTEVDVEGFGGNVGSAQHGGVQLVPAPSAGDLAQGEAAVAANNDVASLAGHPTVTCPSGVADFPVPPELGAASKQIEHIFFIVRENKDFDGVLGDYPGANGDPAGMLTPEAGAAQKIWPNLRALAKQFSLFDNYYTDAEFSTQGHVWTTFGRAVDFDERTWMLDARTIPLAGITEGGKPVEGSVFEWLEANHVEFDVLGEIEGTPSTPAGARNPIDPHYPGGPFQNILYPDVEKSCYIAGRARVRCDLGSFVYATISNDHTSGVGKDRPTPETYCAVNDEATGMLVDAISHSPYWPTSLIVITEDDPQDGGDHVDGHRTPLVLISPWVKRDYVSKTHVDVASLHKLFSHVLGKPYLHRLIAQAQLPLDAFTSTPNYAPYERKARETAIACGGNKVTSAEQRLAESWDFDEADEQRGLSAQIARWMRGKQLEALPPELERAVVRREAARAARAARANAPAQPGARLDLDDD